MRQTRAIIVSMLLSLGLAGAYWAAGAQEGRTLWAPPAVLPADEIPPPTLFPAPGKPAAVVKEGTGIQTVGGTLPAPQPVAAADTPPPVGLPGLPTLPGDVNPPLPLPPRPMFPAVVPQAPAPDKTPSAPAAPFIPPPEPAKTRIADSLMKDIPKTIPANTQPPAEVKLIVPAPVVVVPEPQKAIALPAPTLTPIEQRPQDGIKSFVRIRPERSTPPPVTATVSPSPAPSPSLALPPPVAGGVKEVQGAYVGVRTSVAATSADTSALVSLHIPAVVVEKRVGPAFQPGDAASYQIVVRNLGAVPAQHVRIEDELPPGAKVLRADPAPLIQGNKLIWMLTPLAAQGAQILRLLLDTGGQAEACNRTTVAVSAGNLTAAPIHVAERPQIQAGGLAVRLLGPDRVFVGQPVVLEIRVTNQSGRPVSGLVLNAYLPAGLSHPQGREIEGAVDGTLQPGETRSIPLTTRAVGAGRGMAAIKVATASGLEASAQTPIEVGADPLQVQQGMSTRLLAGREGDCRIEIRNCTNETLHNLTVTDQLTAGLDFVGASDRGLYRAHERKVIWQIEQLPAGQTQTVTMRVFAAKLGQYQNLVTAQADGGGAVRSTAAIVAETPPNLDVKILTRDNRLQMGRDTVYEVQVVNTGHVPATKVQVQVLFPPGLAPRLAEAPGKTKYTLDRQSVIFEPAPPLAPRGKAIYRVTAQAREPGDQHVRFAVASEQARTPIVREISTTVFRD